MNIAERLRESASAFPYKTALKYPAACDKSGRVAYSQLTFAQLDSLVDAYAAGFQQRGITENQRCLLMVKPSLDFIALTFAIFRAGAAPVLIDPGMGVKGFLNCVRQAQPQALVGIPKAHLLRVLCKKYFRSVQTSFTLGSSAFPGTTRTADLADIDGCLEKVETNPDDCAAVLFTSGSTGPAKGVVYTHKIFNAQVDMIRDNFGIGSDDIDLPCFPLFALFSTGLGACAVIPDMDPTRPAQVDPAKIVQAITDNGVTYSFGSPALWRVVANHCENNNIRLPSLRKIFMAGAPVPGPLHKQLLEKILPSGAETHAPYGATECLPVSDLPGTNVGQDGVWEKTRNGKGVCVGKPVPGVQAAIIAISDEPIADWRDVHKLKTNEIGEITVTGPTVTPEYFGLPKKTAAAKIRSTNDEDGNVTLWHRMGDLGYLDDDGRLWVCGRKSQRVQTQRGTLFTVQCESVFNAHPQVHRTALVGVPQTGNDQVCEPVLIVEPNVKLKKLDRNAREQLKKELLEIGAKTPVAQEIKTVLFHPAFPVDVRHNAKIDREKLAEWATKKCSASLRATA